MGISGQSKNLPEFGGTGINPGEIRRFVDMELMNDSRLVLILNTNRADDSAEVVLVNNLIEIATPRDVLVPSEKSGAAFDLVLLPDFTIKAWKQQLEESPVFGKIDPAEVIKWIEENTLYDGNKNSSLELLKSETRGHYIPEFGDHVWLFRGREMDAISSLGHYPEIMASNERFYEIWRKPNEDLSLTDLLVSNNLDLSLIDSFLSNDAIRFELV
jgi:hypothetical protein